MNRCNSLLQLRMAKCKTFEATGMSKLPRKHRLLFLAAGVLAGLIVLAIAALNDNSQFDSERFKNNPDETRLAMYKSLKAKNLLGSSKEQIVKLIGEPTLGVTEDNLWTYPMGQEADKRVELVLTFRNGALKKIQKSTVEKDF